MAVAAAFWLLSRPGARVQAPSPRRPPDPARGASLYHVGSCFACHRPPEGAGSPSDLPTGGRPFPTPIGVFFPQNLTPDPVTGLGRWSTSDFIGAMTRGVSPEGRHYFPAFPYTSYRAIRTDDLLDLWAFLRGLPAVRSENRPSRLPAEGLARRAIGIWKRLAFRNPVFEAEPARGPAWNRGAYLVQGPGHCGECHTPRNLFMVLDPRRALKGGPHPEGVGMVPSLVGLAARGKYKDAADLTLALRNGELLGYENLSSGGMGAVQSNLALAPEDDVRAIADYLLALK